MTKYYCNDCYADKSKKGCRLKMKYPNHSTPYKCVIGSADNIPEGSVTWVEYT